MNDIVYTHEHYPDINEGLGYEQLLLYTPLNLRRKSDDKH